MSKPYDSDFSSSPPNQTGDTRPDSQREDSQTSRGENVTHADALEDIHDAHEPYIQATFEDNEASRKYTSGEMIPVTHRDAYETRDEYDAHDAERSATNSVRDTLTRIPEALGAIGHNLRDTFERAIHSREDYVVAVKVSPEAQNKLEQLVQAGVFGSRAEAAAYLIDEGINAQTALFERVSHKLTEIERLQAELRGLVDQPPES